MNHTWSAISIIIKIRRNIMQNKSSRVISLTNAVYYVSDISELKNLVNQWTDVYRIEITTEISKRKTSPGLVQNNTNIKKYNYYIADEIKTAGELLDTDDKEFQPQISDENKNAPALIVGITPSMLTGFGLRKDAFSPATEFWSKPIVSWHKLNPDTDIVLNYNPFLFHLYSKPVPGWMILPVTTSLV